MLDETNSVQQIQKIFRKFAGWLNNDHKNYGRQEAKGKVKLFVAEYKDKLLEIINRKSALILENLKIFDKN